MDNSEISEPPEEFLCPITLDIMEDPVIATDGYTYERVAIMQHLELNTMSPMTREEMNENQLLPNRNLKDAIDRWQRKEKNQPLSRTREDPLIYWDFFTKLFKYAQTDETVFEMDVEVCTLSYKYKGSIMAGQLEGKGIMFNLNGKKIYEGWYTQGQRDGVGISFYKNGQVNYDGFWSQGKCHGRGVKYDRNAKRVYEGDFFEGIYHGHGIMFDENGVKTYEGDFCEGIYHGHGIMFDENGVKTYEGNFSEGKKHGEGIEYLL